MKVLNELAQPDVLRTSCEMYVCDKTLDALTTLPNLRTTPAADEAPEVAPVAHEPSSGASRKRYVVFMIAVREGSRIGRPLSSEADPPLNAKRFTRPARPSPVARARRACAGARDFYRQKGARPPRKREDTVDSGRNTRACLIGVGPLKWLMASIKRVQF